MNTYQLYRKAKAIIVAPQDLANNMSRHYAKILVRRVNTYLIMLAWAIFMFTLTVLGSPNLWQKATALEQVGVPFYRNLPAMLIMSDISYFVLVVFFLLRQNRTYYGIKIWGTIFPTGVKY